MVNGGLTSQTKENGLSAAQQGSAQRKRLLKAPTLAELDSSDSEVRLPGSPMPSDPVPSQFPEVFPLLFSKFQSVKVRSELRGSQGD